MLNSGFTQLYRNTKPDNGQREREREKEEGRGREEKSSLLSETSFLLSLFLSESFLGFVGFFLVPFSIDPPTHSRSAGKVEPNTC